MAWTPGSETFSHLGSGEVEGRYEAQVERPDLEKSMSQSFRAEMDRKRAEAASRVSLVEFPTAPPGQESS